MITLWGQIIVAPDNVLRRILVASVNNVMTFSAYIATEIYFEMTIFADWQHAVRDNQSN